MDDKQFDDYIKQQLAEQATPEKGDWESMHKRLVEEDIIHDEVSDFDLFVKEEVDKVRMPFNSHHWLILREKLLTERYLKKRIGVVKTIELAMLLLLIWTSTSLVPFKSELYVIDKFRPALEKIASLYTGGITSLEAFARPKATTTKTIQPQRAKSTNSENGGLFPFIPSDKINNSKASSANEIFSPKETITPIASLMPQVLYVRPNNLVTPIVPVIPELLKASSIENVASLGIGVSSNQISAPFGEGQSVSDLGQYIGFTYGLKKGRLELFSGLGGYSSSYKPDVKDEIILEHNGKSIDPSTLEDINYKFISVIPLGVRYHFVDNKNWSFYGHASMNFDILAETHYNLRPLDDHELKRLIEAEMNPPVNGFAGGGGGSRIKTTVSSTDSRGLLQGGSIVDNVNTSATLGFGVVRHLGQGVGLYMQPSYTKHLLFGGEGAQQENIDNLRLDVGLRISI